MIRRLRNTRKPFLRLAGLTAALIVVTGCGGGGGSDEDEATDGLVPIVLQTDWYAQPEHGGFYHALAEGYYEEAGLDVTIRQGGPNALAMESILIGRAQFALGRSDDVIYNIYRDRPVKIAMALMQHDPQALLLHEDNPVDNLAELAGASVMVAPGSNFIKMMELKYDYTLNIVPLDYGMERFLADPEFIQQCFVTNEPYYAEKNGVDVKTILISESGFDPYRVVFSSTEFLEENPEVAHQFVAASIRGWTDYLESSPDSEANQTIISINPKMEPDFVRYAINAMVEKKLVAGYPEKGEAIGKIKPERIARQVDQLNTIGLIDKQIPVDRIVEFSVLPEAIQPDAPLETAAN
ncbi:MAG: ABC transporter substrate-binding protein [Opitutales bacterium]